MKLFYKYQALGNTFILVDKNDLPNVEVKDITRITSKEEGIGADGLILIDYQDYSVKFYNADGSIATMCGNGVRCVIKHLYDLNIVLENQEFNVKTTFGKIKCIYLGDDISQYEIDKYYLEPRKIPVDCTKSKFIKEEIIVDMNRYEISSINVGNVQTVLFTKMKDIGRLEKIAKVISNSPIFFEGTNVNFVNVIDENNINVLTYERGVGFTKSCGTGACASAFFSYFFEKTKRDVIVHNELGILNVKLIDNKIQLKGPAKLVCKGELF